MRRVKVYCGIFWLLFAAVMGQQSFRLPMGVMRDPGTGFFPLSIAVATGLLALLALAEALREQERSRGKDSAAPGSNERFRWWNLIVILAALIGYVFSLPALGFLISTFWFMLLLLKVIEPQGWSLSFVTAAITAVVSELFFNVLLNAQIPKGILGF